jgi:hypothetical protein
MEQRRRIDPPGHIGFWQAPSWEEIAAAEAKEKPEIRLP